MKKILLMTTVLMFALTFGLAYADEMTKTKDMSAEEYNGITIFARGPAVYDAGPIAEGSEVSTSGVLAGEELSNGVTILARGPITFDAGPELAVESSAYGSSAGGLRADEPEMGNGVTIFHVGPVNFDD